MQIINSGSRPGLLNGNVPGRSVNSSQLERWLGREECERISQAMKDWYGPPIALAGVPGAVYAHKGGDFRGELRAGGEATAKDKAREVFRRMARAIRVVSRRGGARMDGFSSLSDLIAEATVGGKRRDFTFGKVGTLGVVGFTNTLWFVGSLPAAGAAAGAVPGGTAWTDASTGAFVFTNPTGGDTLHFVRGDPMATVSPNTLMLYDRLFSVTFTIGVTTAEAVTGVPTRYQSTTTTADDYIGGNFVIPEIRTALPATAHNLTVCTYTDQAAAASTLPSITGLSSGIVNRLDTASGLWFSPLESGDTGIQKLTQIQKSAVLASGAIDMTIGHPIAIMPCPIANVACTYDGINTAFNLTRIFDDACLAFLEMQKGATTATTYNGMFAAVAG